MNKATITETTNTTNNSDISTGTVNTAVFLGDSKAKVRFEIPFRLSSEYSRAVIGASIAVELTCNQDDETINHALEVAHTIVSKTVKEKYDKLIHVLVHMDKNVRSMD
jgi:hypothetical protein